VVDLAIGMDAVVTEDIDLVGIVTVSVVGAVKEVVENDLMNIHEDEIMDIHKEDILTDQEIQFITGEIVLDSQIFLLVPTSSLLVEVISKLILINLNIFK